MLTENLHHNMIQLLLLCFVFSQLGDAKPMTTRIDSAQKECFTEYVNKGFAKLISWEVTSGGQKDIDVSVMALYMPKKSDSSQPTEVLVQQWKARQANMKGDATWTAGVEVSPDQPSRLRICFDNTYSHWTGKWVSFEFVDKAMPSGQHIVENNDEKSVTKELENILYEQSKKIYNVRTTMRQLEQFEKDHRSMVMDTNNYVFYGGILNGIFLIAASFFQFWWLKKFLAVRAAAGFR